MKSFTKFGELKVTGSGAQGPQGAQGAGGGAQGSQGNSGVQGQVGGYTLLEIFSSATSGTPASGKVFFNNATYPSVTQIKIHEADRNGVSLFNILESINPGDVLKIFKEDDATRFIILQVTARTFATTHHVFDVSYIASNSALIDGTNTAFSIAKKGAQGTQGAGAQGAQGRQGFQGGDGRMGGYTLFFAYDGNDADPPLDGSFNLAGDVSTGAILLRVSDTDLTGADVGPAFDEVKVGDHIKLQSLADPNEWTIFRLTSFSSGAFHGYGVVFVAGVNLTDVDGLYGLSPVYTGSQGFQGLQGAGGSQGAQGSGAQGAAGAAGSQGQVGGYTILHQFSTTLNGTPANGTIRFDNAVYPSVLGVRVSETDRNGVGVVSVLANIGVGDTIKIFNDADATKFIVFSISSVTDSGTFYLFGVTYIAGNSTFANGSNIALTIAKRGPQGSQGTTGAQGSHGAQGNQGNQGAQGRQGFQGLQGASGAQGAQGAQGTQGTAGSQGAQGFQGRQGFQGATGTGAQGAQGFQGGSGSQGSQGTATQIVTAVETGLFTSSVNFGSIGDSVPGYDAAGVVLSVTITPTSAGSKLRVRVVLANVTNTTGGRIYAALYRDPTGALSPAIAVVSDDNPTATNFFTTVVLESADITAGSTSPTTFKVVVATGGAGTCNVNGGGSPAGRVGGGTSISKIEVREN